AGAKGDADRGQLPRKPEAHNFAIFRPHISAESSGFVCRRIWLVLPVVAEVVVSLLLVDGRGKYRWCSNRSDSSQGRCETRGRSCSDPGAEPYSRRLH